jgi:molecular chaperone HscA
LVVESLLQRLDADASSLGPKLIAFVSEVEREALRTLLQSPLSKEPSVAPVVDKTVVPKSSSGVTIQKESVVPARHKAVVKLDLSALDKDSFGDQVVCLDFGTAKSKAFASLSSEEDPDPADLVELGLGRRDRDQDGAVYSVNSSIWITQDGYMFAGSDALRQSADSSYGNANRRRLDSIKQELNLSNFEKNLSQKPLEPEVNPTATELSYEDALCFFLAYLTDLTGEELASTNHARQFKRRFTLPCWREAQRRWASAEIHKCLRRAQILADTFRGHWKDGIPVDDFKDACTEAAVHESKLGHLMDDRYYTSSGNGILEPLAAGSGRVWADRSTRNLVLVLDVGAGTTDYSLFWVVQDGSTGRRRAFPVMPSSDAIRMAGDTIDDILLRKIFDAAHGDLTEANRNRIAADLRLTGLRRLKEQLFTLGKLDVRLVTDQVVSIDREQFENSPEVTKFAGELERSISEFLSKVDNSWIKTPSEAMLVLTGGCARLPFIQGLGNRSWTLAGKSIRFSQSRSVPEVIASNFDADFQREYPQLAVAIGGALPLIDERSAIGQWQGGSPQPGTLEKFAVTGQR